MRYDSNELLRGLDLLLSFHLTESHGNNSSFPLDRLK
jgi:hypothetical protein